MILVLSSVFTMSLTFACTPVYATSQARVFIPSRATAKTLVQAGHVTPRHLPKSGRFLISVFYAIKGGVAKYNMSLSCMSEPLEMPKRNKKTTNLTLSDAR